MTRVFADILYWVASISPGDPWYHPALQAVRAIGIELHLVTTEEVLTEVLSAYGEQGSFLRGEAIRLVHSAMSSGSVTVLHQSHHSFLAGLALYENRRDKGYSLLDCISMASMRDQGLTTVLTNDHHFTQEGFLALIRK